jgi:hypothetical protein
MKELMLSEPEPQIESELAQENLGFTRNSPEVLELIQNNRDIVISSFGTRDQFFGFVFRNRIENNPNLSEEEIRKEFRFSLYPFFSKNNNRILKILLSRFVCRSNENESEIIKDFESCRSEFINTWESIRGESSVYLGGEKMIYEYDDHEFLRSLNDYIFNIKDLDEISLSIMLKLLTLYWSDFDQNKADFEGHIADLKESYKSKIGNLFNDFAIQSASYTEIIQRYENVDVTYMEESFAHELNRSGTYNASEHSIKVALNDYIDLASDETMIHTFNHESTHAVAGASWGYSEKNNLESKRSGVSEGYFDKLNWLNEAITEYIARYINNKDDTKKEKFYSVGSYGDELQLFFELLQKGASKITIVDFFNAYFEDGSEQEYKNILMSKLGEVYDPSFLEELWILIQKDDEGVLEAVHKIRNL